MGGAVSPEGGHSEQRALKVGERDGPLRGALRGTGELQTEDMRAE